jgi:hypothetical protein
MCLDQSFREHLPAAAATSLCRLLTLFGADALSRAALAACDAAPLALCVALYQCVSSSHPSPSTLRCDAVLRCGVDVRLFLLSRFKRSERNSWDPVTSTPCIPTPHSSPHDPSDAVLRCGIYVRLSIVSRFKRLERNMVNIGSSTPCIPTHSNISFST